MKKILELCQQIFADNVRMSPLNFYSFSIWLSYPQYAREVTCDITSTQDGLNAMRIIFNKKKLFWDEIQG